MRISSIIVAMDSVSGSHPLVEIAVELAHKNDADLTAVFIEEHDWFEVSRFNFSHQVSSYTGNVSPLTEDHIFDQIRAHSSLLKQMVEKGSQKHEIRYSYRSMRGFVKRKLMELSSDKNLVIIGRNRHPDGRYAKVGRTALYLAENCPVPVLVWNNRISGIQTITGLCKDPESSVRVVDWSLKLGKLLDCESRLAWPDDIERREEFKVRYQKLKRLFPENAEEIMNISQIFPGEKVNTIRHQYEQLIVVDRKQEWGSGAEDLLRQLPHSILFL